MNFWDAITGNDMTRAVVALEARAARLSAEHRAAWDDITAALWTHSDFTGRNLLPILDGVLGLLEETAADGQSVPEVFGNDIQGFCSALVSDEGAKSYRDKWREQLNAAVARKLGDRGV